MHTRLVLLALSIYFTLYSHSGFSQDFKKDPVISHPIKKKNQDTLERLKSVDPIQKKPRPLKEVNTPPKALSIGTLSGNLSGKPPKKSEIIRIESGESRIFHFDDSPITAIIGNPKVVSSISTSDGQLILTGNNLGSTNLVVLGKNKTILIDVVVAVFQGETNVIQVQRPDSQQSFYCNPKCTEFHQNKTVE